MLGKLERRLRWQDIPLHRGSGICHVETNVHAAACVGIQFQDLASQHLFVLGRDLALEHRQLMVLKRRHHMLVL